MNLAGLDLNLLKALNALLQESSVSRAAQSVGLTQPAMSNALKRLREFYGDELLVRSNGGMECTQLGRSSPPRDGALAKTRVCFLL